MHRGMIAVQLVGACGRQVILSCDAAHLQSDERLPSAWPCCLDKCSVRAAHHDAALPPSQRQAGGTSGFLSQRACTLCIEQARGGSCRGWTCRARCRVRRQTLGCDGRHPLDDLAPELCRVQARLLEPQHLGAVGLLQPQAALFQPRHLRQCQCQSPTSTLALPSACIGLQTNMPAPVQLGRRGLVHGALCGQAA